MASSHRPGKEVETSEVMETVTLVVTRHKLVSLDFLETHPKIGDLRSLSPSIFALQAILGIEFSLIFALAKLKTKGFPFQASRRSYLSSFLVKLRLA